jgi:hypothetical protein
MCRLIKLTLFGVLTAVVAVAAAAPATGGGAATTPRGTLLNQTRLFNAGNWPAMYRTFTARFRRSCPYRTFVAQGTEARSMLGRLSARNIRVRTSGNRAALTYQTVAQGTVVQTITRRNPDIYVRIRGRWYDQVDSVTSC